MGCCAFVCLKSSAYPACRINETNFDLAVMLRRVRTGPYVPRNEEARRIRENPPSPSVSSARPPTRPSSPVPGHNNTAPPNAGGATTSTSQVNAPPPTPSRESSSEVLDPSPGRPQGENGEGMQPAPPGVSSVGEGSVAMS